MSKDSEMTAADWRLPRWLAVAVMLLFALAHTQVTVRHLALRLAGVQYGYVATVSAVEDDAAVALIEDPQAGFRPEALVGTRLFIGDGSWEVLGNTRQSIRVAAPPTAITPYVEGTKTVYYTNVRALDGLASLAVKVPGIAVTLADLLLGPVLVLLAGWVLLHSRESWRLVPVAAAAVLLIGLWSLVEPLRFLDRSGEQTSWGAGVKEWLQQVEVLLCGLMIFRVALRDRWLRRGLLWTGLGLATLMVGAAIWEYAMIMAGRTPLGLADVHEVDGLFGFSFNPERSGLGGSDSSKNVLAVYLMMAAPVILAAATGLKKRGWRIPVMVLAGLAMVMILSLPQLVAALLGCLAVAACWRPQWALPATVFGAIALVTVVSLIQPQHAKILLDSGAIHKYQDPYGALPVPLKGQGADKFSDWSHLQQKASERQAALQALSVSPLLGHGLGHYQERINKYYTGTDRPMPFNLSVVKPSRNAMERDAHGQYFITGVETGILGLGALLWLLFAAAGKAARGHRIADNALDKWVCAGILGALVAVIVGGFMSAFLVRGLSILLMALIGYAYAVVDGREDPTVTSA